MFPAFGIEVFAPDILAVTGPQTGWGDLFRIAAPGQFVEDLAEKAHGVLLVVRGCRSPAVIMTRWEWLADISVSCRQGSIGEL